MSTISRYSLHRNEQHKKHGKRNNKKMVCMVAVVYWNGSLSIVLFLTFGFECVRACVYACVSGHFNGVCLRVSFSSFDTECECEFLHKHTHNSVEVISNFASRCISFR